MNEFDTVRKKNIYSEFSITLVVLFFIGILYGCNSDESVDPDTTTAKVVGKVSAESVSEDDSIQNTLVKLIRMDAQGKEETVSLRDVVPDAQGKFVLETYLDGVNHLFIKADKNNTELRGILGSKVRQGIAVYMQPLNQVTTISADLFKSILISNGNPDYTGIQILIDEEIASTLDSNRSLINNTAAAFQTGYQAEEATFLRQEIGGTTSQWEYILSTKVNAQSALDRDLYYAASVSSRQKAYQNYLGAVADAYADSGLQFATFSKVLEVSTRVFLKEIKKIDSRLNFEFVRRTSEIRAGVLNTAVQYEFERLGADPSVINEIIYAGEELENSISYMQNENEISDAYANYKDTVIDNLKEFLGGNGMVIDAIEENIMNYKNELISIVDNSNDQTAVIDAYMNFYGDITNLVLQQISADGILKYAANNILILVNLYY